MQSQPLSDLTSNLSMMRQSKDVRAALEAAGREMSTGRVSDLANATNGRLSPVFAIERSLDQVAAQLNGLTIAGSQASFAQVQLGRIASVADDTGLNLISAIDRGDPVSTAIFAQSARSDLDIAFSTLNEGFAGKFLFSGAADDGPPLATVQRLVDDITTLIDGSPSPADALMAVEAYFSDPGGGFETDIFLGTVDDGPTVMLDQNVRLSYLPRADAPEIREMLQGLAIAAAVSDGAGAADPDGQTTLLREAGATMMVAKDGLIAMRETLGVAEARLADTTTQREAERSGLELGLNERTAVDPYEAAARFAALESQLEALYTVTARLSSLSFTNFVR